MTFTWGFSASQNLGPEFEVISEKCIKEQVRVALA